MSRSRNDGRYPTVVKVRDGDAFDTVEEVGGRLIREIEASMGVVCDPFLRYQLTDEGDMLFLPGPGAVRVNDLGQMGTPDLPNYRSLRSEEYDPYYDALRTVVDDLDTSWVHHRCAERYFFDWDSFDHAAWAELDAAYTRLPGWLGAERGRLPTWFGTDERLGPAITAGVEPGGLDVYGTLPIEAFEAWHGRFLEETEELAKRGARSW